MWGCVRPSRLIAVTAALLLGGAAAAGPPGRVVSMNLCTDQLAMLLAAEGQIVSVSMLAADPMSSAMPEVATAIPANTGHAEEIFLMRPDLVLASRHSDPAVVAMLHQLGVRVAQIEPTRRLSDVPDRLREVGRLLWREARAEELVAGFEAGLAELKPDTGDAPLAALFSANGFTQGMDTLAHDILTHAGLANLAARLGRSGGGRLALEEVVIADPDLLILSRPYPATSRAEEIMAHPALRATDAARAPAFSGPDWVCGTPHVLSAIAEMAARRRALTAAR